MADQLVPKFSKPVDDTLDERDKRADRCLPKAPEHIDDSGANHFHGIPGCDQIARKQGNNDFHDAGNDFYDARHGLNESRENVNRHRNRAGNYAAHHAENDAADDLEYVADDFQPLDGLKPLTDFNDDLFNPFPSLSKPLQHTFGEDTGDGGFHFLPACLDALQLRHDVGFKETAHSRRDFLPVALQEDHHRCNRSDNAHNEENRAGSQATDEGGDISAGSCQGSTHSRNGVCQVRERRRQCLG